MELIRRRLTPTLVVALLALFFALGGVGAANNGDKLVLGSQSNSAASTTALSASVVGGKALQISNNESTNAASTALGLNVAAGHAPFTVNSSTKVTSLNSDYLDGVDSTGLPYWKLGGNAGTIPGSAFLGTVDAQALDFRTFGRRAYRLEPGSSPNVIGGFGDNHALHNRLGDVVGATIAGGGKLSSSNVVADNFGTVGGGYGNRAGDGAGTMADREGAVVGGGHGNTASGNSSLVAGGSVNTASGTSAAVGGGTANIASGIGAVVPGGTFTRAVGDHSFAAGFGARANQSGSFVWSDAASTFTTSSQGANTFVARATGGVRFISGVNPSTGAATAGVLLPAGASSWSTLSDRAAKERFEPVDKRRLLRRLVRIPISSWSWKSQRSSIRHVGPVAQDFRKAFGLGEDARHIDTVDADGVALAAIQGLYRQNLAVQGQNRALQRENRSLRAQLGAQNARLTKLEQAFSKLSR
jgi:hypothetical protein